MSNVDRMFVLGLALAVVSFVFGVSVGMGIG